MNDWTTITSAIEASLGGDKEHGHRLLSQCWEATVPSDHARRCLLAHYLADTETDLNSEVAWDETALFEHAFLPDGELAPLGIFSVQALLPSLQLNLADGYFRQGRIVLAQEHLLQGQDATSALEENGYGTMIRSGLANLARRIAVAIDG